MYANLIYLVKNGNTSFKNESSFDKLRKLDGQCSVKIIEYEQ